MQAHTVVVGDDGSDDARRALDAAMDHVADGGIIHVVTAFDDRSRHEIAKIIERLPAELENVGIDATPAATFTTPSPLSSGEASVIVATSSTTMPLQPFSMSPTTSRPISS